MKFKNKLLILSIAALSFGAPFTAKTYVEAAPKPESATTNKGNEHKTDANDANDKSNPKTTDEGNEPKLIDNNNQINKSKITDATKTNTEDNKNEIIEPKKAETETDKPEPNNNSTTEDNKNEIIEPKEAKTETDKPEPNNNSTTEDNKNEIIEPKKAENKNSKKTDNTKLQELTQIVDQCILLSSYKQVLLEACSNELKDEEIINNLKGYINIIEKSLKNPKSKLNNAKFQELEQTLDQYMLLNSYKKVLLRICLNELKDEEIINNLKGYMNILEKSLKSPESKLDDAKFQELKQTLIHYMLLESYRLLLEKACSTEPKDETHINILKGYMNILEKSLKNPESKLDGAKFQKLKDILAQCIILEKHKNSLKEACSKEQKDEARIDVLKWHINLLKTRLEKSLNAPLVLEKPSPENPITNIRLYKNDRFEHHNPPEAPEQTPESKDYIPVSLQELKKRLKNLLEKARSEKPKNEALINNLKGYENLLEKLSQTNESNLDYSYILQDLESIFHLYETIEIDKNLLKKACSKEPKDETNINDIREHINLIRENINYLENSLQIHKSKFQKLEKPEDNVRFKHLNPPKAPEQTRESYLKSIELNKNLLEETSSEKSKDEKTINNLKNHINNIEKILKTEESELKLKSKNKKDDKDDEDDSKSDEDDEDSESRLKSKNKKDDKDDEDDEDDEDDKDYKEGKDYKDDEDDEDDKNDSKSDEDDEDSESRLKSKNKKDDLKLKKEAPEEAPKPESKLNDSKGQEIAQTLEQFKNLLEEACSKKQKDEERINFLKNCMNKLELLSQTHESNLKSESYYSVLQKFKQILQRCRGLKNFENVLEKASSKNPKDEKLIKHIKNSINKFKNLLKQLLNELNAQQSKLKIKK